jgi:hypothetical protein
VNKAFEQIALIPGIVAAAFVGRNGALAGWCANSAIPPERLNSIGVTCRSILAASRAEKRDARTGWAAFGPHTLVFREGPTGLFLAYLDSPVNDAVLDWLFAQVNPLLAKEGIALE